MCPSRSCVCMSTSVPVLCASPPHPQNEPLHARRALLQQHVQTVSRRILHSEAHEIRDEAHLRRLFDRTVAEKLEGLVVKDRNSPYEPDKRHWLKIKKDHVGKVRSTGGPALFGLLTAFFSICRAAGHDRGHGGPGRAGRVLRDGQQGRAHVDVSHGLPRQRGGMAHGVQGRQRPGRRYHGVWLGVLPVGTRLLGWPCKPLA